jgi:acetyl esterase/lipase
MDSEQEVKLFLENKRDNDFKTIFHTDFFNGMKLVSFKGEKNLVILYIHGGAYVNDLNIQHSLYCFILNKVLKMDVILPAYPLTPAHNFMESYELITQLYKELTGKYDDVILMGDSAGGGFVLGFCQYLNEIKLKQPRNIIVFSPWVDISMENSVDNKDDPILVKIGLTEIGKRWSDNNTKNHKVSPIYGDNHNLPRTLIIVGSNEIFYQDILRYYEKLVNDDVDVKLIVGEDLFHIYPLFPIPEAIDILKEIKHEITL